MLEKFRNWYMTNYTEITWFIIGWLCMDGFYNLGRGAYGLALISFGLAWFNIWSSKRD